LRSIGRISETAERLIAATQKAFHSGVAAAKVGARIGDIGAAVEATAGSYGFSTVREFVGHGIGEHLHESPDVPNYGTAGRGCRLYAGMTIAIEPMVNAGASRVKVLDDGWTVVTADGSLSAHYEHTVAILGDETVLLTDVGE
jgi:methionyl aminopeptidase